MNILEGFRNVLLLVLVVVTARKPLIKAPAIFQNLQGVVEFYKFEACNVSYNQAVITGFKMSTSTPEFRGYDADLYVKTDLIRMKSLSFKLNRCKEAISYNTCEHFAVWKFDQSPCELMNSDKVFWHSATSTIHPPFTCPLKANVIHKFTNFSCDGSIIIGVFGLDAARRRDIYELEVTSTNELNKNFACTFFQFKFVPRGAASP